MGLPLFMEHGLNMRGSRILPPEFHRHIQCHSIFIAKFLTNFLQRHQSFTESISYTGKEDSRCDISKRSKHQEKSVWLVLKNARKIEMKITRCGTAQIMEQDETPLF